MFLIEENPIIAAVHSKDEFDRAMKSQLNIIFLFYANILTLKECIDIAHANNKKIFVHADMTEGIAKDNYGVLYIAKSGADGIISTRGNLIKKAQELNLKTVQRFFIIDFHSMDTAIESIKTQKPDMIEIMPGVIPKVISKFKQHIHIPIITGGLIETKKEIIESLKAGATAISTSNEKLWND